MFSFFIKSLFKPLDIFGKEIFAADLIPVPKMIDSFVRKQPNFIECFRDEFFFTPINIPVIIFSISIASDILESLFDGVIEVCFKFYLVSMIIGVLRVAWVVT